MYWSGSPRARLRTYRLSRNSVFLISFCCREFLVACSLSHLNSFLADCRSRQTGSNELRYGLQAPAFRNSDGDIRGIWMAHKTSCVNGVVRKLFKPSKLDPKQLRLRRGANTSAPPLNPVPISTHARASVALIPNWLPHYTGSTSQLQLIFSAYLANNSKRGPGSAHSHTIKFEYQSPIHFVHTSDIQSTWSSRSRT